MQRGQNEVSCHGRFIGDLSSFTVTNFSNQNDVGILPQDCTKRARERQSAFFMHFYLGNVIELVFDWIFDRNDIQGFTAYFVNHCIKRCCFPASSWTYHKHDALGAVNQRAKCFLNLGSEVKFRKGGGCPVLAKKSKDDLLSMLGRKDR